MTTPPAKTHARPGFRLLAAGLLIGAAAVVGLAIVPASNARVGPAVVSVRAHVGSGDTTLRLPPLGTVTALTHWGPIDVELAVQQVDIEELGTLATSEAGRDELSAQVEDDLQKLLPRAALQAIVGAALIGAIAGALIWHRGWRRIALGASIGAATVTVGFVAIAGAYDVDAFEQPRYSGPITRASEVIDTLNRRIGALDEAGSRYRTATRRVSDLLALLAQPNEDPREADTALLHVSDIHANPLAFDVIDELVAEFEVDAIIDTGDLASAELDTGELSTLSDPLDRVLAREIGALGVPYAFVPGNHDPPGLIRRVSAVDDVQLLDGFAAQVAGVSVLGWPDPTFTTEATPEEEKEEQRLAEAPEVSQAVALEDPFILAVHDVRLADESFGQVPFVLAGHTHERSLEVIDGTVVLTVGSTGATGLKSFTVDSDRNYDAEVIYLQDGDVIAVDYISLENVGGDFTIERRSLVDIVPEPLPTPTPTES